MTGFSLTQRGPAMFEASNADLVVQAQRGNAEAVGALYDQHYRAIFRYLRARVSDHAVAEDLTGELFRRMLVGLPNYRSLGLPFRAWLFRIAHNLVVDHYRQRQEPTLVALEAAEFQPDPTADPALIVEQTLTLEQAQRALAALEPPQREVVALRFLSGLPLREVALALNRSEDAVKALQRRGLAALRLTLIPE